MAPDQFSERGHRAVVLLGKSAFASAPVADMQRLARLLEDRHADITVTFGFSEQGNPSLRETLLDLRARGISDIVILPLLVPLEPSLRRWLAAALLRWQSEQPGGWPRIRIGQAPGESPLFADFLDTLIADARERPPIDAGSAPRTTGSLVPAQKRRVLVCQGPDCHAKGASALWGHLRNVQERLKLRTVGAGTMTAMSTCLGPCSLAPVLQVFPEGTYYGGVTEAAIDRIAGEHLRDGHVVEAFAYHPTGKKQTLRP